LNEVDLGVEGLPGREKFRQRKRNTPGAGVGESTASQGKK